MGKELGDVGAVQVTVAEASPAVAATFPGADGAMGVGGVGSIALPVKGVELLLPT